MTHEFPKCPTCGRLVSAMEAELILEQEEGKGRTQLELFPEEGESSVHKALRNEGGEEWTEKGLRRG